MQVDQQLEQELATALVGYLGAAPVQASDTLVSIARGANRSLTSLVAVSSTVDQQASRVVVLANSGNWLDELVVAILADADRPPVNPAPVLRAACAKITAQIPAPVARAGRAALPFLEAPVVNLGYHFVNRNGLRSGLLRVRGAPRGIVLVRGPQGKSYSINLLSELLTGAASPYYFHDAEEDAGERGRLPSVVAGIAELFGFTSPDPKLLIDRMEALKVDQETRLAKDAGAWLLAAAARGGGRYWLVFDGLDKPVANPAVTEFVSDVGVRISRGQLTNVYLVVLGLEPNHRLDALNPESDSLSPITATEVEEHVERLARLEGIKPSDAAIKQMAADAAAKLPAPTSTPDKARAAWSDFHADLKRIHATFRRV
jgi:hypothetical protein